MNGTFGINGSRRHQNTNVTAERSPKGTPPRQPRPSAWVERPNNKLKPRRGGPNRDAMNHTKNVHRHDTLGSPRWGFARGVATVTQAVGLGWHRDTTLWRKTVKP